MVFDHRSSVCIRGMGKIKRLAEDFVKAFDAADAVGLDRIEEIVTKAGFNLIGLKKYYPFHLSYKLDERKLNV
jgi:chorismate dehydratase